MAKIPYPRLEEVDTANQRQICQWYRFLPSPQNGAEVAIMDRIVQAFHRYGGFTTAISKDLGWTE